MAHRLVRWLPAIRAIRLSYSITAGNTSGAFSIDSSTGVLSVSNSAALVYATNPTFSLTVKVTDTGGLTATANVTVNVNPPGTPAKQPSVIANQPLSLAMAVPTAQWWGW